MPSFVLQKVSLILHQLSYNAKVNKLNVVLDHLSMVPKTEMGDESNPSTKTGNSNVLIINSY